MGCQRCGSRIDTSSASKVCKACVGQPGETWEEETPPTPEEVAEWKADSKRLDILENADIVSLYTLPDGRKIIKLNVLRDFPGYEPEAGTMTLRELIDNEAPALRMLSR